jgi:dTDP-4-dehydrorhamnose 3,5-epimerase
MEFVETGLRDACLVEIRKLQDERGFFARSFCQNEFREHGLDPAVAQCNISRNLLKGTLRGMHFQVPPAAEAKLVRCTRGAIYDVILDIRPESPTFLKWAGYELSAENYRMLFIPKGFAHGFITLEPDTEVFYQMSEFYAPGTARGVRWDDPLFNITWPIPVVTMSEKDQVYPDSNPEDFTALSGIYLVQR